MSNRPSPWATLAFVIFGTPFGWICLAALAVVVTLALS